MFRTPRRLIGNGFFWIHYRIVSNIVSKSLFNCFHTDTSYANTLIWFSNRFFHHFISSKINFTTNSKTFSRSKILKSNLQKRSYGFNFIGAVTASITLCLLTSWHHRRVTSCQSNLYRWQKVSRQHNRVNRLLMNRLYVDTSLHWQNTGVWHSTCWLKQLV